MCELSWLHARPLWCWLCRSFHRSPEQGGHFFLQHAHGHVAGCRVSYIHSKGVTRSCCRGWLAWLRVVGFFMHGCSVRMGLCFGYGV